MIPHNPSLRLRLLLATLLVLPLFLVLTGVFLDRAFNRYQLQQQQEAMRLQQLLLARAADWTGGQWQLDGIDEPRLLLPESGLSAFILAVDGDLLWASPSARDPGVSPALLRAWSRGAPAVIGQTDFRVCGGSGGEFCFSQRLAWGSAGPEALFLIVEDGAAVAAARTAYRGQMLAFAAAATLLLLLAQWLIFRWGLAPLGRIARALDRLRRGETRELEGEYPRELQPLTENLRQLLDSERDRRERVRNTMDRLAHVLRSPLMLIRNSREQGQDFRALVQEQVERMLAVVEGELARARLEGQQPDLLAAPVLVKPVLERITLAYGRLPRPHSESPETLHIDTDGLDPQARFRGEQRDLQDLFGSLLENAMKYANCRIEVTGREQREPGGNSLVLQIADDGEGIPPGLSKHILERGARADTASPGYGVGLAIVIEIVSAYGGSLSAGESHLGGALFTVTFPQGD